MTQNASILHYLRNHGNITTFIAFKRFAITRLSGRIYELKRDGHLINATLVTRRGKTYAAYSLVS